MTSKTKSTPLNIPRPTPLLSPFRRTIAAYDERKIRAERESLESDLNVSVANAGTFSRPAVIRALNHAPQNYLRAVRLAEAVRRIQADEDLRMKERRAWILTSARADLIETTNRKTHTDTAVEQHARSRFKSQWNAAEEAMADARSAVAIVDSIVRAWRDRAADLRRMLDERV